MYDNSSRVIEIDINEILPNRFQPRIQFDEEENGTPERDKVNKSRFGNATTPEEK